MTTTSRPAAGVSPEEPTPRKSALSALLNTKPWETGAGAMSADDVSLIDVPDNAAGIGEVAEQSVLAELNAQMSPESASQDIGPGVIDCEWSEATESLAARADYPQADAGDVVDGRPGLVDSAPLGAAAVPLSPSESLASQVEEAMQSAVRSPIDRDDVESSAGVEQPVGVELPVAFGAGLDSPTVQPVVSAPVITVDPDAAGDDVLSDGLAAAGRVPDETPHDSEPVVPPVSVAAKPSTHTRSTTRESATPARTPRRTSLGSSRH